MKNLFFLLFFIGFTNLSQAQCCSENSTSSCHNEKEVTTKVILIRHAEKVKDGTRDPELSPEGQERANRLIKELADETITAIYSTDYKRTRNTVLPIANKLAIDVELYDPRSETALGEIVEKNKGKTILIVGHSNTVPTMLNFLEKSENYSNFDESEYSRLFIVNIKQVETVKVEELAF